MIRDLPIGCPCCGYDTVLERNQYHICPVCWWEDDGQDNEDADKVWGGPNADLSLSQARKNFLLYGRFDPRRNDLVGKSKQGHKQLRTFTLDQEGNVIESTN
ncbi:MAG: hypothetical protein K2X77_12110 [Candidatus Obscuribacterales bacterium]|nr:hypothetical protein [Candidatus Obscuribacterales bacterium]